jgi:UDP-N-acetylmuramyl pentapeptide phosphotransferase/UDP-N-acetylglucosamine-1-phosphate transferase
LLRSAGPYAYPVLGRRRQPDTAQGRPRRAALAKRWIIPAIGAVTPIGLIVVNISVFIVKHLSEFRWTIAILAFVSSIMLNSWAGLNIYRVIQHRRPDHALVHERNQEVVLVGGMGLIIAMAFLTALFCYLGLSSEANLPNGVTFITGVVAILLPFVAQAAFRQATRRSRRERANVSYAPGMPPSSPPTSPPVPPAQ